MPVAKASIIAVFEALPAEVAGLRRTRVDPFQVSYGPDQQVFVRAGRVDDLDPCVRTAARFSRPLARSGEVQIEEEALDPEGELVYVVATGIGMVPPSTSRPGVPLTLLGVRRDRRPPRRREALAEAFVAAVNASA